MAGAVLSRDVAVLNGHVDRMRAERAHEQSASSTPLPAVAPRAHGALRGSMPMQQQQQRPAQAYQMMQQQQQQGQQEQQRDIGVALDRQQQQQQQQQRESYGVGYQRLIGIQHGGTGATQPVRSADRLEDILRQRKEQMMQQQQQI